MGRLKRGEDAHIDRINDLVAIVKSSNSTDDEINEGFRELLETFKPMILRVCDKWAKYFNDSEHKIKPFNELVADAEYWFVRYTKDKYTIDGDATFNKFIKDHIDQRIRYIYECELKYYKNLIFPDPIKHEDDATADGDSFELVIYNYSSDVAEQSSMEDDIVDDIISNNRAELAKRIIKLVETGNFNEREKKVFMEVMYNGITQEEMSKRLQISRTRVVQILRKIKCKLKTEIENDEEFWNLISQTDIEVGDNYL